MAIILDTLRGYMTTVNRRNKCIRCICIGKCKDVILFILCFLSLLIMYWLFAIKVRVEIKRLNTEPQRLKPFNPRVDGYSLADALDPSQGRYFPVKSPPKGVPYRHVVDMVRAVFRYSVGHFLESVDDPLEEITVKGSHAVNIENGRRRGNKSNLRYPKREY